MRNLIGRRLLSYLLCLCIILSMAFTQTVYADSPSEQLIGIPLKNAGFETAGGRQHYSRMDPDFWSGQEWKYYS